MSSAEFLSRWSRRKREARRDAQRESEPAAEREPVAEAAADPAAAEGEAEITPEEVAALPRIEDLTPDTDITAFLRKGVPEVLKNAALRRMWSLDPAIRDYVSEAREYAYDWNVPGGVPGNGPLLPTDDVGAMLGRIFGDDDREPETAMPGSPPRVGLSHQREPELPAAPPPEANEPGAADDAVQHETGSEQAAESAAAHLGRAPLEGAVEADCARSRGAPQKANEPHASDTPRPRRHGGAAPV
ncbi:MAG TPA: DUF3306 domain-containing protein [Microvirga sp.]|nr:DUF3306 domain-containing protein [Microvirga sp.]